MGRNNLGQLLDARALHVQHRSSSPMGSKRTQRQQLEDSQELKLSTAKVEQMDSCNRVEVDVQSATAEAVEEVGRQM